MYNFLEKYILGCPECKDKVKKSFIDFANKAGVLPSVLQYLDYAINPEIFSARPLVSFTRSLHDRYGSSISLRSYEEKPPPKRLTGEETLALAILFLRRMILYLSVFQDSLGIFVDYNNRNNGILLKKLLTSDSSNISREIFYSLFLLFSGITVGTHFKTLDEFRLERCVIKNEQRVIIIENIKNEQHYQKVQSVADKNLWEDLWEECQNTKGRFYYASGSNVCQMGKPCSYKELCERLVYYFNDQKLSVPTKEENRKPIESGRKPIEAIGGKETLFVFPFCGIFFALINMFIYDFLNDVIPFLTYFLPVFTFAFMIGAYEMIEELRKEISVPLSREIIISLRIYMIACIVFPAPFILIPLFVVASIFSCHMYVTLGKGVQ